MNLSTIRTAIKTFIDANTGTAHVSTINFDSDFVTGNVISGDVNGVDFLDVTYATSHAATLQQLAFAIQDIPSVRKALVTGAREITVTAYDTGDTQTATIAVTGGATQPVATQTTTTAAESIQGATLANQKVTQKVAQCIFKISSVVTIGVDGYQKTNFDTNLSLLVGNRLSTLTIDYTGDRAMEKISRLYNEIFSERWRQYFLENGLVISTREQIIDLTGLLDTEFQERASFDCYLRFRETTEMDLGTIETVNIEGHIQDEAGNDDIENIVIETT